MRAFRSYPSGRVFFFLYVVVVVVVHFQGGFITDFFGKAQLALCKALSVTLPEHTNSIREALTMNNSEVN